MPESMMVAARPAGRFGATQLVAVELTTVAAIVAAYALPAIPGVVAAVAAGLLLIGAVGRFGGRWGYEAVAARLRLWRRATVGTPDPANRGDPTVSPIMPGLATLTVTDRSGPIGVGHDPLGWFGVVALRHRDGLSNGGAATLPLDWLVRLARDDSLPASTLQVGVRRSDPVAGGAATWADQSYRELWDGLSAPAYRDIWLAVRLAPRDAAIAGADRGGGPAGVQRALVAALTRVSAGLSNLGVGHDVLDGDGLRDALLTACHLDRDPAALGSGRERWSRWQAPATAQVCLAVRAWPASPVADPFTVLTRVPGALSTTAALVLARRGDRRDAPDAVATRALVRVVATPSTIGQCVGQLRSNAARAGLPLVRLNGEHAAGIYATAPTGAPIGLVPW